MTQLGACWVSVVVEEVGEWNGAQNDSPVKRPPPHPPGPQAGSRGHCVGGGVCGGCSWTLRPGGSHWWWASKVHGGLKVYPEGAGGWVAVEVGGWGWGVGGGIGDAAGF